MKRKYGLCVLFCWLIGCSTHPITDVCDYFKPGKLGKNEVTPYGGVGVQQGQFLPQNPAIGIGGPAPAPFPGGGFVPPPAPLPGNRPPPGVQVQPPQPIDVPLPPSPPPTFVR